MKSAVFIILTCAFCALGPRLSAAETPDPKTLSADFKRLDALRRVFAETQAHGDQFGDAFWRASKRLADERGPAVLHAVMARSEEWRGGEEGLVFVPLVSLLPREATLKILRQYQSAKGESARIWAGEFITEFGMSDTREAVRKYSSKK